MDIWPIGIKGNPLLELRTDARMSSKHLTFYLTF
jgi:hypothetical protein